MKIGILDLLTDTQSRHTSDRLYAAYFRRQFVSITPQAVSVWCRALGHEVHYATYYGQGDPGRLMPDDLDVLFVAAYTQVSALAYALARLHRRNGTLTVIGGPHARSFPTDCLRFFDIVVHDCDKALVDDIVSGRFDPPSLVTSGRTLPDLPSVEERLPEIKIASFDDGRPMFTSLVPMLASLGCPYTCDFCVDWNNNYRTLPKDRLSADLRFLSDNYPNVLIGYHDPNFAVRFDETMDIISDMPAGRRNPYIMESTLSILKGPRLKRLTETNCVYVAPGVESWIDYSNKAGLAGRSGADKLNEVVQHFKLLSEAVPGLQANFLFGGDVDEGAEPADLTTQFIKALPTVWPNVNIPSPFGGTPLYDRWLGEGRILETMPFSFYYNPYLAVTLKHYHPVQYYDHLVAMNGVIASNTMLARRLAAPVRPKVRLVNGLRTIGMRRQLRAYRTIRDMLATDADVRAFHERRTRDVPEFYHRIYEQRLGRYAELIPRPERVPVLEAAGSPRAPKRRGGARQAGQARRAAPESHTTH